MFRKTFCVAALAMAGFSANASIITTTASYGFGSDADTGQFLFDRNNNGVDTLRTKFSENVTINMFDDLDGQRILESISLSLIGLVSGNAGAESLDAAPSEIELNLAAKLSMSAIFGSTELELISTSPVVQELFSATAFDGVEDRGGTSGVSFNGITGTSRTDVTYDANSFGWSSIASFFTGDGQADVNVAGVGSSFASGSGNISTLFSTNASGFLTVDYNYNEIPEETTSVSEPGSIFMFGSAALMFAARRFTGNA